MSAENPESGGGCDSPWNEGFPGAFDIDPEKGGDCQWFLLAIDGGVCWFKSIFPSLDLDNLPGEDWLRSLELYSDEAIEQLAEGVIRMGMCPPCMRPDIAQFCDLVVSERLRRRRMKECGELPNLN